MDDLFQHSVRAYFQVLSSALEGIELPYAKTRCGTISTDTFPTSCGSAVFSFLFFSCNNYETADQFFALKDQEFLSNSACLVHFIFSGINLKSDQATVPCLKWLFCWFRADEEIMVKYMYQNFYLKIQICCSQHFSLIYTFLAELQ